MQRVGEAGELGIAPDERGRLQEAFAGRERLEGERSPERLLHRCHHVGRIGEAVRRVLAEQSADDGLETRIDAIGGQRRRPRHQPVPVGCAAVDVERMAAGEQLVEHDAEREEVRSNGRGGAAERLGREVREGPADAWRVALGPLAVDRQAEVQQLDLSVHDQQVVGLDVAVDDAAPVDVRERAQRLDDEVDL